MKQALQTPFTVPELVTLPRFNQRNAFEAYEQVRPLFPDAAFPTRPARSDSLAALTDLYDLFVFDAFGVLNVGETVIPGAVERIAALEAAGKTCLILSNAASYDTAAATAKFSRLGFDFAAESIVTSRQAALRALAGKREVAQWTVLGLEEGATGALPFTPGFARERRDFDKAEGFLFLSTARWSADEQAMLEQSLARRPRPVVIANPDIIAPREGGLSTEPGFYGYRLKSLGLGEVIVHGKPFPSIYDLVAERVPDISPRRTLMIGDTLHTDILGAAAAGWKTALATANGMLTGLDIDAAIKRSGIVPDHIVPSI